MNTPHFGINFRELDRAFEDIGGQIIHLRRTGEKQYRHHLASERPRGDGRRKDAPRHMVRFVLRIVALIAETSCHQTRRPAA